MSKQKYYAVKKGRKPGLYDEWFGALGAEVQIRGYSGAVYKGFTSREEAEAWIRAAGASSQPDMPFAPAQPVRSEVKTPRRSQPMVERSSSQGPPSSIGMAIYTDGGCSKNPGPGGYGAVLLLNGQRRELSGGYALTTNNRMELTACIKGLEALDGPCAVTVYSDSQYLVNGITKGWARRWKRNNWMRNSKEPAENSDLWNLLLDLCEKHDVKFQWVRGHNGNQENECCDRLAVEMTQRRDLPPDPGYKKK